MKSNHILTETLSAVVCAVLRGLMGTVLLVVENTEAVHNVVVCTLCSCYPIASE